MAVNQKHLCKTWKHEGRDGSTTILKLRDDGRYRWSVSGGRSSLRVLDAAVGDETGKWFLKGDSKLILRGGPGKNVTTKMTGVNLFQGVLRFTEDAFNIEPGKSPYDETWEILELGKQKLSIRGPNIKVLPGKSVATWNFERVG